MRGTLDWTPLSQAPELVADPVREVGLALGEVEVAPIDATLADTAAFCEAYRVPPENSANCVVVAGRRGEVTTYAAVMVLATDRADVNGVVRKDLGVRKISFAPQQDACDLTGMEYGGITPIGLPAEWPILVDSRVLAAGDVVIGSGLRSSKILVSGERLLALPDARELALTR